MKIFRNLLARVNDITDIRVFSFGERGRHADIDNIALGTDLIILIRLNFLCLNIGFDFFGRHVLDITLAGIDSLDFFRINIDTDDTRDEQADLLHEMTERELMKNGHGGPVGYEEGHGFATYKEKLERNPCRDPNYHGAIGDK